MKSYFLEAVVDPAAARAELSRRLPARTEPWLIVTDDGAEAIAFLNVYEAVAGECEGPFVVQADVSGRHFQEGGGRAPAPGT